MDESGMDHNLASTTTLWGLVRQANSGPEEAARHAREVLLNRYRGAVHRYLLGAVGDHHVADDLAQEFFLRFVRGDFRNASPEKGRFRDLLKTTLYHLIVDHQRRQKANPQPLPPSDCFAGDVSPDPVHDERFLESWRKQLLAQAWKALRDQDVTYYAVLYLRAENDQLSSAEMAVRLSGQLGTPVTADWVRTRLRRAREMFADLLLEELAQTLENPTRERLEEELADLRLLTYCQDAVVRRRPQ
jgi:RNA polymerase sigma factor (sigma-70 family)